MQYRSGYRHRPAAEGATTELPREKGGGGIDELLDEAQATVEDLYRLEVQRDGDKDAAAYRGRKGSSPATGPSNRPEAWASAYSCSELEEIHRLMRFR